MLRRWCTGVMRSKVEPMKDVARMIVRHFDGIVAWAQTRQTNGFIEAINGLFQAAKRKALGYASFKTICECAVPHRWQARLLGIQSAYLVSTLATPLLKSPGVLF
jgi:hypothetical protein